MYRYRITLPREKQIADFEHKASLKLSEGSIVDEPSRPRVKVTKIVQQPKALFGMEVPLVSKVGVAEAETFRNGPGQPTMSGGVEPETTRVTR
jgi:hypothetical protein